MGIAIISFENRFRCKDGSYVWLAWTATPSLETGLLYAAGHDVTERRRAEAEIAALNASSGRARREPRAPERRTRAHGRHQRRAAGRERRRHPPGRPRRTHAARELRSSTSSAREIFELPADHAAGAPQLAGRRLTDPAELPRPMEAIASTTPSARPRTISRSPSCGGPSSATPDRCATRPANLIGRIIRHPRDHGGARGRTTQDRARRDRVARAAHPARRRPRLRRAADAARPRRRDAPALRRTIQGEARRLTVPDRRLPRPAEDRGRALHARARVVRSRRARCGSRRALLGASPRTTVRARLPRTGRSTWSATAIASGR